MNSVIPANHSLCHNLNIKIASLSLTQTKDARKLGVMFDDYLSKHVTGVSQSYPIIIIQKKKKKKIKQNLTQHPTQPLVQNMVISHLDYCSSFLAGPPS